MGKETNAVSPPRSRRRSLPRHYNRTLHIRTGAAWARRLSRARPSAEDRWQKTSARTTATEDEADDEQDEEDKEQDLAD